MAFGLFCNRKRGKDNMKKLSIFGVVALLLLGLSATALAADIKAYGKWQIEAAWRKDNDFLGKGATTGEDNAFNIEQRIRLGFQFIANENLKGVFETQVGADNWGNGVYQIGSGRSSSTVATTAGANAAGYGNIMLRKGYIDFKWPGTKVNFLVGYQTVSLPAAFGGGSAILDDQVAAAVVSAPITDNVSVLAGYARPYDAQSAGTTSISGHGTTADVVFAAVPVTFKGFNITPFGAYANIGDKAANGASALTGTTGLYAANATTTGAQAYWAGLAFTMTAFEPFKVMADINWGKATWNNAAAAGTDEGRSGWMFDFAVDYTGLKFMTPELFFAYSSGEDGNSTKNQKSERMPLLGNPQNWSPGGFFFGDRDFINGFASQAGYVRNVLGFWTLGLSMKDISFIERVKHTVNVMYVKGTNDKDSLREQGKTAITGVAYGAYLTEKDSLWEVDLNTKYMMYDQLSLYLNLGYINADFDKDVWGSANLANAANYKNYGSKDAYRIGLGLTYAF
jgi:hypothetical protein